MNLFRILVSPLALLYLTVTHIRNKLFNWGALKQYTSTIPVISIGNLSMGGTGKTPHVAYILEHFRKRHTTVISRGYRRKSKHLIEGNKELHTSQDLGDEPMELLDKFNGEHFKIIVENSRVKALKHIENQTQPTELILLDDGYQHRYADRHLNILLTEYNKPFYNDFVLPMGTLRESRTGAKRADVIVMTKCPKDISLDIQEKIKEKIKKYSSAIILFSQIEYDGFENQKDEVIKLNKDKTYLLVTGIANPQPIYQSLSDAMIQFESMKFPDHHHFSQKDLQNISQKAQEFEGIITTEKDWMRLRETDLIRSKSLDIFRIKMGVNFINPQQNKAFRDQLESVLN